MNELVEFFCEAVSHDSLSGEEQAFLEWLAARLGRDLGADCSFDEYGNLIARLPGGSGMPIALSAHADTVRPGQGIVAIVEDGVIRSQGDTILAADDKAGIAAIWAGLRRAERRPPVEFVVTRQEEVGLLGAKHLDVGGLRAQMAFVLDGDELDTIVIGGPSHFTIDIDIHGRAAHAGMEPEKGVSAIKAAACAIAALPEGRIDQETTANIGTIRGGLIRNGVPEHATLAAECRSLVHEKAEGLAARYRQTFEQEAARLGARAEVKVQLAYRASRLDETEPVVRLARAVVREVMGSAQLKVICGGTDASIFNGGGLPSAVLGMGARGAHTTDEHIRVEDLERAAQIVQGLVERAADGGRTEDG